ncbi:hypothetical protein BKA63DRAFT_27348 [Paraphoma chrysanthemicola]|nr:hypothetical protein BKA63DRAFT_27348 [Paraphoma chrysanthemicola]
MQCSLNAYSKSMPSLSAACTMNFLVFASGARSRGRCSSLSFLSNSAPLVSSSRAASPCPSLIAWCSAVWPSTSVAFSGLFASSRALIMGTLPTAAARCSGSWPRLSLTRALAGGFWLSRVRAMSRFDLEAQKCRAVWPLLFFAFTSASLPSSRSTMASASFREQAIMSGVQPEPSVTSASKPLSCTRCWTMGTWL